MSRRPLALLAALAAAAVLLVACGDDDAADDTTTTEERETTESTAPDDDAESSTEPSEPEPPTDLSPEDQAFCDGFRTLTTTFDEIDDTDMDATRAGLSEVVDQFEALDAPDAVADQFASLTTAVTELRDLALEAESLTAFETEARPILTDPGYEEDGGAVSDWVDANCPAEPEDGGDG